MARLLIVGVRVLEREFHTDVMLDKSELLVVSRGFGKAGQHDLVAEMIDGGDDGLLDDGLADAVSPYGLVYHNVLDMGGCPAMIGQFMLQVHHARADDIASGGFGNPKEIVGVVLNRPLELVLSEAIVGLLVWRRQLRDDANDLGDVFGCRKANVEVVRHRRREKLAEFGVIENEHAGVWLSLSLLEVSTNRFSRRLLVSRL